MDYIVKRSSVGSYISTKYIADSGGQDLAVREW